MDGACKARQSCRAATHFPMVCMREIRDGRSTTTKMAGKMQKTRGKTIFTGAFIAWVLALWRRRSLMLSAWMTRVSDMEAPSLSDWTTDMTKRYTSCTSQRFAMSCMERRRVMPILVSRSMRRNSSIKGPSILSTTLRMAPSRERPACTEMERRSSTSGSWRMMSPAFF